MVHKTLQVLTRKNWWRNVELAFKCGHQAKEMSRFDPHEHAMWHGYGVVRHATQWKIPCKIFSNEALGFRDAL
ncbi:unnamed protein product [Victoria cruziana]